MAWLDKLKTLVNVDINSPIISINFNSNSNNRNTPSTSYDPKEKKLEIYIDSLEPDKRKKLEPIIKEYIEEGNKLLEKETSRLLYRLYKYNEENRNSPILSFFKPIVSSADYAALEASLFLRSKFTARENVEKLKNDIRKRFGDRGNNISNLCTAGYFEEFLMPLYNSSKDSFKEQYEIIVSKAVLAVFVNRSMSPAEIKYQIIEKLQISKNME